MNDWLTLLVMVISVVESITGSIYAYKNEHQKGTYHMARACWFMFLFFLIVRR